MRLLLIILCSIQPGGLDVASDSLRTCAGRIESLSEQIQSANEGDATKLIYQLVNVTKNIPYNPVDPGWREVRREQLELYVKALGILRSRMDPNFNPKTKLYVVVSPPMNSNIEPGDSPDSIKDPVLRKSYQDAIAANQQNVALCVEEHALENATRSIVNVLKIFVHNSYSKRDRSILEALLENAPLSNEDKSEILKGLP